MSQPAMRSRGWGSWSTTSTTMGCLVTPAHPLSGSWRCAWLKCWMMASEPGKKLLMCPSASNRTRHGGCPSGPSSAMISPSRSGSPRCLPLMTTRSPTVACIMASLSRGASRPVARPPWPSGGVRGRALGPCFKGSRGWADAPADRPGWVGRRSFGGPPPGALDAGPFPAAPQAAGRETRPGWVLSASQEADVLGVGSTAVVKTVVLATADCCWLAVIPASCRVDLHRVRDVLCHSTVRLASEEELLAAFPRYELSALPPLGGLLGVPALMDPRGARPRDSRVRRRNRDRVRQGAHRGVVPRGGEGGRVDRPRPRAGLTSASSGRDHPSAVAHRRVRGLGQGRNTGTPPSGPG